MKKALAVVLAAVAIGVCTGAALAQVPFVQVYFDNDYNDTQSNCLPPGTESSLYVAALNINALVSAIDFKVLFPPAIMYTAELPNTGPNDLVIGNAQVGEAQSYNLPRNGYMTMLLTRVFVQWTAECDCYYGPYPIVVVGYDDVYSPHPKAAAWPDNRIIELVGMTSLICPGQVSTQPTTWGGVKALYR